MDECAMNIPAEMHVILSVINCILTLNEWLTAGEARGSMTE